MIDEVVLVGIGNAWCVIPVSFNKKKMALIECKWVQCQKCDKTSHVSSSYI